MMDGSAVALCLGEEDFGVLAGRKSSLFQKEVRQEVSQSGSERAGEEESLFCSFHSFSDGNKQLKVLPPGQFPINTDIFCTDVFTFK